MLQRPRPTAKLAYRFEVALATQLHVRALTGLEMALANEEQEAGLLEEIKSVNIAAALVAASLYSADGPVFSSAERVLSTLDDPTLRDLWRHVVHGLSCCSPSYLYSDSSWWEATFSRGVEHTSNVFEVIAMAQCCDVNYGSRLPRPDRYFGLPVAELTDGQRMAYDAAFRFVERMRPKKNTRGR